MRHFFVNKVSVAPMLQYTDRHSRYFFRLLSPNLRLYTEMVVASALLKGRRNYFLNYDPSEHPLALQLGGADPQELALCARIAEEVGYDEVNLNIGCPSDRVKRGGFGACLMAEPERVAECIAAMVQKVGIPITLKTRIGIDNRDSYEELSRFIELTSAAGCTYFIIHARKAWLKGLNPKENRTLPPLKYEIVYQLKQDFPQLCFILNGGIQNLSQAKIILEKVDGVMIGRAFYQNIYQFADLDKTFYDPQASVPSREMLLNQYFPYLIKQYQQGVRLRLLIKPILSLFQAQPGARLWRASLSQANVGPDAVREAAALMNLSLES